MLLHHTVSLSRQLRLARGTSTGSYSSTGVEVMSKRNRSFLVVSALPLVVLGSVFAVVRAEEGRTPAIKQAPWSDPATWPDRKVPRAGDTVTIERGKDVLLDVSPPPLGGLNIGGKLSPVRARVVRLSAYRRCQAFAG
jgi:G8 domain